MAVKASAIDEASSEGRRLWPDIVLSPEAFLDHVERLGIDETKVLRHAADLFLVAAVLSGQPNALRHFDERLATAARVASRIDSAAPFIDDVLQELRIRLLSGPESRLRSYSAAGSLKDWLRVAALRVGLNLKRSDCLLPAPDLELEHLLGPSEPPAPERHYLDDFKEAIEASLSALTPRERTLLRLHFVDGMNIERIGVMYSVHRATVARWLVRVRERVFEQAKAELGARHGLKTADVKSLYRALERDVHASISRILRV